MATVADEPRDTGRAMSQENIELSRRGIAAAVAQPPDLETVREVSDPDLVLTTAWGVDAAEHLGVQGFLDALAEMAAAFDPWRQDIERLIDAGQGRVVAFMRLTARGKESGVPVEFPWAIVITVRGGRIAAARVIVDRDEALRAVGLEADFTEEEVADANEKRLDRLEGGVPAVERELGNYEGEDA
jgi:ketosteroid isomerase-like protein